MARSDYQQRQQVRRDRLERAAERAQERSDAAYSAADEIAKTRPLGQPIIVGHHSERRARADQARIERNMRRSISESKKAKDLESKAQAVGTGGISSDDPEAVWKLRKKLGELEARHAKRKAINAAWRRAGKPDPDDTEAWTKLAPEFGLSSTGVHHLRVQMASRRNFDSGAPFPAYALTNTTAEMRRIRKRIDELLAEAGTAMRDVDHGVCRLIENTEMNRVQLVFDGKPSEAVRSLLKQHGFRWARSEGAWQRLLNDSGRGAANWIVQRLKEES